MLRVLKLILLILVDFILGSSFLSFSLNAGCDCAWGYISVESPIDCTDGIDFELILSVDDNCNIDDTYTWVFGDSGEIEGGTEMSYDFGTEGAHIVTVTYTGEEPDGTECEEMAFKLVNCNCQCVYNTGEIEIAGLPSCGYPVQMSVEGFSGPCSGEPENVLWDFGDGNTLPMGSIESPVSHAYNGNGAYEVSVSYSTPDIDGEDCYESTSAANVLIGDCEDGCDCELSASLDVLEVNGCQARMYLSNISLDPNCAWFQGPVEWYVNGVFYESTPGWPDFNIAMDLYEFGNGGLYNDLIVTVAFDLLCAEGSLQSYSFSTAVTLEDCHCDCLGPLNGDTSILVETTGNATYDGEGTWDGVGCDYGFWFDPGNFDTSCGDLLYYTEWYARGEFLFSTEGQSFNSATFNPEDEGIHGLRADVYYICSASGETLIESYTAFLDVYDCIQCDCIEDSEMTVIPTPDPCFIDFDITYTIPENCGQVLNYEHWWTQDGALWLLSYHGNGNGTSQVTWPPVWYQEDGTYEIMVEYHVQCPDGSLFTYSHSELVTLDGCDKTGAVGQDTGIGPATDSGTSSGTDSGSTSGQTGGSSSGIVYLDDTGTDGGDVDDGGHGSGGQASGGQASGGQSDGGQTNGIHFEGNDTDGRIDIETDGGKRTVHDLYFEKVEFTIFPSILRKGDVPRIATNLNQETFLSLSWMTSEGRVLKTEKGDISSGHPFTSTFSPEHAGTYLLLIEGNTKNHERVKVVFY